MMNLFCWRRWFLFQRMTRSGLILFPAACPIPMPMPVIWSLSALSLVMLVWSPRFVGSSLPNLRLTVAMSSPYFVMNLCALRYVVILDMLTLSSWQ